MDFTFPKEEKLKSKKVIDALFDKGKSVSVYPLRLVFIATSFNDDILVKTGVSVSKRHFKRAVDRNRIKRLLREAFRLNKPAYFNNITTQYALMILYIGNTKPTFSEVETKMKLLLEKFNASVTQEKNT
ncbi:MAG TPA: ribonuclease P protein component [Flavobacteriaceae bacterium]|nr:ribonuclease P protein component [Flavobacteriaceae bacterium]